MGALLTLPLLAIMVSDLLPSHPLQQWLGSALGWIEFALATPVVLWGGWPFFERGWASIVHRSLNMFTLIAMGSGAAYLYSVAAVAAPGLFPRLSRCLRASRPLLRSSCRYHGLVLVGQVLELRARSRTSGAIQALLGLAPKTARRISPDGNEADVSLSEVAIGDLLRVRPAKRYRWMARWSRGTARWTNRW